MKMKKICQILMAAGLLVGILGSTINVKTVEAKINFTVSYTSAVGKTENYTCATRDSFYDLNDNSVNRATSEHFQIIWGNGDTTGTVNQELVKGNLQNLEAIRDFYVNVMGFVDTSVSVNSPLTSSNHYKTNVYISNTGLSKITDDWAYMSSDGEGFAFLVLHPGAMRVDPPSWVVPHEYAHAITMHQRGVIDAPWYEVTANWFRDQYLGSSFYKYGNNVYGPDSDFFRPIVLNSDYYFPHLKNYYDAWPFLLYVTENPDQMKGLGLEVMKAMFKDTNNEVMFKKLERLSGTSAKDMLGGYARRMVTFDFKRQANYKKYYDELIAEDSANYNKIYTTLENDSNGWFKVPSSRAPQQGGYNIIPLNIDLKSKQVVVNFQGNSSEVGADWRASIVAKTKTGQTRYSTMWNSGTNTLNLQGDEEKVYLVVCATPKEMLNLTSFDLDVVGTRYPYKVQISTNSAVSKVEMPTVSVAAGSYNAAQTISLSSKTSGTTIYYTLDGSTPTASSTAYSSPIVVSKNTTIKAVAIKSGMTNSDITSATYTISIIGDVNEDGRVNAIDYANIKSYLLANSTKINLKNADMNNDSKVNAIDLALLKKKLLS
ncbi:DUF6055 domain-containing protein [Clostridium cellulovorans]|uniref:Dockerin type 1 n=2 Tax=Clostridium cellulovorans TaxID=1493 RepID=D9SUC4_CLOC7|nr:DUF6055 domain-containing protein [Clostridium cellulovorans]ADL52879.1 Dockerin type 1 [Clostridium cellulovorans 743B]BAV13043.1 hypothetical protein [Clostridium cellulovorans]